MAMGSFRAKAKSLAFVTQRKITDFPSRLKQNLLAKSAILLADWLYFLAHNSCHGICDHVGSN